MRLPVAAEKLQACGPVAVLAPCPIPVPQVDWGPVHHERQDFAPADSAIRQFSGHKVWTTADVKPDIGTDNVGGPKATRERLAGRLLELLAAPGSERAADAASAFWDRTSP